MDIAIVGTLIAASVSIIGWIINYILSGLSDRKRQILSASIAHIEKQLAELYGPLSFLIIEGTRSVQDMLEILGKQQIFEFQDDLSDEDLSVWKDWIDNDMFPRNEKIRELLSTKAHLIEGSKVPQSYLDFLEHHNSWTMFRQLWQMHGKKYAWHEKLDWPAAFGTDVISTFETLKIRQSQLLGKITRAK